LACSEPDNTEVVELLLLQAGVDINIPSHAGQTPAQVREIGQAVGDVGWRVEGNVGSRPRSGSESTFFSDLLLTARDSST
jgi:hypothetical protein